MSFKKIVYDVKELLGNQSTMNAWQRHYVMAQNNFGCFYIRSPFTYLTTIVFKRAIPSLFFFIFVFSALFIVNNYSNGWVRAVYLWSLIGPLWKLCHSHFQIFTLYASRIMINFAVLPHVALIWFRVSILINLSAICSRTHLPTN